MGLSTERKVFIGLAGIAGIALLVDQGLMGPGEASAAAALPDTGSVSTVAPPTPAPEPSKPAAAVLIDRLKSKLTATSDPGISLGSSFSLASLIETDSPAIELSTSDLLGPGVVQTQAPAPTHQPGAVDLPVLSAVMPAANGGGAVLGGKMLMVGQVGPNGCKLLGVRERGVLVEKDGHRYTIQMPVSGS